MGEVDAIEMLRNQSEHSRFSEGYYFSNRYFANKPKMDLFYEMAKKITEELYAQEKEFPKGRFVFWGSTYENFIYLLFVVYDEVNDFLNFVEENNDTLDYYKVAKITIDKDKMLVEIGVNNKKLLLLKNIVENFFEEESKNDPDVEIEIKINENG